MKRLLIMLICFVYGAAYSQSRNAILSEIEGTYQLDEGGNVTYTRIVEAPGLSKNEIYKNALSYLIYDYGNASSAMQLQDEDSGTIIAKRAYDNVHTGFSVLTTVIDSWHIIRVDTKNGKARFTITLTEYNKLARLESGDAPWQHTTLIKDEYPINPKGRSKTVMGKAFYKTYKRVMDTMNRMEVAVKEGKVNDLTDTDEW